MSLPEMMAAVVLTGHGVKMLCLKETAVLVPMGFQRHQAHMMGILE